ncbi:MAG: ABC transporter ATP-binding protein [Bacteroidales bacterium]
MLKISNLSVKLGLFELRDITFEVARGEYFVLLGMSGAGKSVLLRMISGLTQADTGEIVLNGKLISNEKIQKRRVGMVFQDSVLFPHMDVYSNIAYPLRIRSFGREAIKRKVGELAELTNVNHLLKRFPQNLSGGESQRVALARILATEPDCLLLDEPLSSLDVQLRGELRSLLRRINENGQTIVHVTHDYEEAVLLAHRIGVIEQGTIVQTGEPRNVFHHPKSEFVARFVGIRNFFPGELIDRGSSMKIFRSGQTEFSLLSDEPPGEGFIVIRAEDIVLSGHSASSSAINIFSGKVVSLEPARLGTEVIADTGVMLAALVTDESVDSLKLNTGSKVWLSFKASAIRYIKK